MSRTFKIVQIKSKQVFTGGGSNIRTVLCQGLWTYQQSYWKSYVCKGLALSSSSFSRVNLKPQEFHKRQSVHSCTCFFFLLKDFSHGSEACTAARPVQKVRTLPEDQETGLKPTFSRQFTRLSLSLHSTWIETNVRT